MALIVPGISVTGSLFIRTEPTESRAIDVRLLGGGFLLGAFALAIGLTDPPFAQELVFLLSMAVVVTMLVIVTRRARRGKPACDPLYRNYHFCVPRDARGGRWIFLVDARCLEF